MPRVDGPAVVIGSQDFGESAILSEIYGQALSTAGYDVDVQALGGFRDLVYTALGNGDINFTVEYAASALEFLNGFAGEASSEVDPTLDRLRDHLAGRDLAALRAAPAANSNALVVTPETARDRGLVSFGDLTDDLRLGGPADCPDNASCIPGLVETYGVDLSEEFVALDGGGPVTVAALAGGEIDVAVLFSTSGVIADRNWVVLEDDRGLINADNVVPVVSDRLLDAYGEEFVKLVDRVSVELTTDDLTELNRRFDIDKDDADAIAADWLNERDLVG